MPLFLMKWNRLPDVEIRRLDMALSDGKFNIAAEQKKPAQPM